MGCVGIGLDDFCHLTPLEFTAVFEAWQQREEHDEHRAWEQTRFLACSVLQPYSKKKLELTDVCRFAWETKVNANLETEASTKERFEMIKAFWNDDTHTCEGIENER